MRDTIEVRGARQNNLKGIDLGIPRHALTVLTGPSGSGKSSLAFDTIYAEGQRRYIESLSSYARQFLERMEKPAVDRLEGVSPAVAIDQRNSIHSSRSTVGTATEVYDYLRLLWARIGRTYCPTCGERVVPDTVQSAADRVLALPAETPIQVTFPCAESAGSDPAAIADNLRARGFLRVWAQGREWHLDDLTEAADEGAATEAAAPAAAAQAGPAPAAHVLGPADGAPVLVIVDRLRVTPEIRERLTEALATAFAEGDGRAIVRRMTLPESAAQVALTFHEAFRCARCERDFVMPTPTLFSFNHPAGACPECTGFGATLEYDPDLIVPDSERSLADGALDPWSKPRYWKERARLLSWAAGAGVDAHAPWSTLSDEVRHRLLYGERGQGAGCDEPGQDAGQGKSRQGAGTRARRTGFQGVIPFLRSKERKRYKQYIRVFLRQYQRPRPCAACGGGRLRAEAGHVRIEGITISAAAGMTLDELATWMESLEPSPFERALSSTVRREIRDRLGFLLEVGLGYLTLDRQTRSLSGGEMQRIRLASSLGSALTDTLYVLDEPTIGLHPRDVHRFLFVLGRLRDAGNTVLVVEHEPAVMEAADRIVELGPGSGERGGEVVFEGDWEALRASDTATGKALRRRPRPSRGGRSGFPRGWLHLRGAHLHNIRDLDVEIPLGGVTVVSGVSGSGKSTLVHDILYRTLEGFFRGGSSAKQHLGELVGGCRELEGAGALDDVVLVDQSPIGRTPRSNPVTYIGAFGRIRRVFAAQPLARSRGYTPGHFSFNVEGGRCEACKGAGWERIEMVFMADVSVICDVCAGTRFRPEILEVRVRGRSIADVLELTADEAIRFFLREDRLGQALWQLQRVGLGYLRLGQPATTLSGGEAQRLKIARELARASSSGRRLYLLDEPTVGLGLGEIERLVGVLEELVSAGHTVVVVEHNLDVIARADWVIDLGPEAGQAGGRIVAAGAPEAIMAAPASHTGEFLRRHLAGIDFLGDEDDSRAGDRAGHGP